MPRSSSSLTSEASLKRGGGSVKCCSGFRAPSLSSSFFERRQLVLQRLVFFVLGLLGLFIHLEEAFELEHRSGDAEVVAR